MNFLRVPVIIVEDSDIVSLDDLGLPRIKDRWRFETSFLGYIRESLAPERPASRVLKQYENALKSLKGPAIVMLDLQLEEVEPTQTQLRKVEALFASVKAKNWDAKKIRASLHLATLLTENRNWHGVICFATKQATEDIQNAISSDIERATGDRKHRIVVIFSKPLSAAFAEPKEIVERATDKFICAFSLQSWFLLPPQVPGFLNLEWFDRRTIDGICPHNADNRYGKQHAQSVKAQFSTCDSIEMAKALVCSYDRTLRTPGLSLPCAVTSDVIRGLEYEGLNRDTIITLPVQPALPFLILVERFLSQCVTKIGGTRLLRLVQNKGEKHAAIGVKGSFDKKCLSELCKALSTPRRKRGELGHLFRSAFYIEDEDISGTPLARLFSGQIWDEHGKIKKRVCTPILESSFVGVSWQTKTNHR